MSADSSEGLRVIIKRGKKGILTLVRRVPKRFVAIDDRKHVFISLHTDSMSVAQEKAANVYQTQVAVWEARLAGRDQDAIALQARLKSLAELQGFAYLAADRLAEAPLSQILDRLTVVKDSAATGRAAMGDAVLGAAAASDLMISGLFERFRDLTQDKRRNYSSDQQRRWANARTKAVTNWLEVIGDRSVTGIDRAEVLKFRAWWWARVSSGKVKAGTANKDFSHLGAMLRAIYDLEGIDARNPFHGVQFEDDTDTGVPFSRDWIRKTILAPGALDGLNDTARDIFLGFINTGARPSELVNLASSSIVLDNNIPHIIIAPEAERRLKTRHSARSVPLTGVSLEAFRRNPDGFSRYRDKASRWSALVVPFLRNHGLLEKDGQNAYSVRHTFSDSLQNIDCPDRTRKELMGHVVPGVNYGEGASLETKLSWVERVAF